VRDAGPDASPEVITLVDDAPRNPAHANGNSHDFYVPAVRAVAKTADQLRRVDQGLVEKVRERPLASIAVALVAGYAIGRILSRWG
jgi:hypothetical protein